MTVHLKLAQALTQKNALKVISGLNNFDQPQVTAVVKAAEAGGATFVDIAAQPDLVSAIRQLTTLPICVSAVDPKLFVSAVNAGADLIEIGNFDSFYSQGRKFEAPEVLELTQRTRALLPKITLSVTVPHILALAEPTPTPEAPAAIAIGTVTSDKPEAQRTGISTAREIL